MGSRVLLPALGLLALALLAACGSSGGGLSVSTPPASASATPATAGSPAPAAPGASAPTGGAPTGAAGTGPPGETIVGGRYVSQPAVVAFQQYEDARTAAIVDGSAQSPALISLTSPQRFADDTAYITQTAQRGWTVRGTARWSVVAVLPNGTNRLSLRACQWDASFLRVDARTGQPEEKVSPVWKPYDVEMLHTGSRWIVDELFTASSSCAGAR